MNAIQQRLASLASITGTDPTATDANSLRARAGERRRQSEVQEDANAQALGGMAGAQQTYFNTFNRRKNGDFVDHEWAPFFESLAETGERQGMPSRTVMSATPSNGPSVGSDPQWWLSNRTPATTPDEEAANEDAMPASLRGLYRSQYMRSSAK